MDTLGVILLVVGVVVLLIIIGLVIYLLVKKKKMKTEINKEVSEVETKSKGEMDTLIEKSTINELLAEGKGQLDFGNVANAKKIYKRLLHEYDSLEKKDRDSYTKIKNFYQKILDSSQKTVTPKKAVAKTTKKTTKKTVKK